MYVTWIKTSFQLVSKSTFCNHYILCIICVFLRKILFKPSNTGDFEKFSNRNASKSHFINKNKIDSITEEFIFAFFQIDVYLTGIAISFIGGGKRSSERKPPTCRKSLTNNNPSVRSSHLILSNKTSTYMYHISLDNFF